MEPFFMPYYLFDLKNLNDQELQVFGIFQAPDHRMIS